MILAVRTDKPVAELHLFDLAGHEIAAHEWHAHRSLAATLVSTIQRFLHDNGASSDKLTGIIVYSGAGSFTGLRIGATVANAMAYSHAIPVAAGEGADWLADGLSNLKTAQPGEYVIPTYDREPNITKPKN